MSLSACLSLCLALRQLVRLAVACNKFGSKNFLLLLPLQLLQLLLLLLQLGRLGKCRSRGLCAAPDETRLWRVDSGEWRVAGDECKPA